MDHFLIGLLLIQIAIPFWILIAYLKLCAAAALIVINVDKRTYSVINSEDYILKKPVLLAIL